MKKAKKIKKLTPLPAEPGRMEIPDFLIRDKDNIPKHLKGADREAWIASQKVWHRKRDLPSLPAAKPLKKAVRKAVKSVVAPEVKPLKKKKVRKTSKALDKAFDILLPKPKRKLKKVRRIKK